MKVKGDMSLLVIWHYVTLC